MLTLYTKPGCPFCAAVLHKVEELGLEIDEKSISDDAIAEELIEKGGKRMVPYLIDTERDVAMYESADINTYLDEYYSNGNATENTNAAASGE